MLYPPDVGARSLDDARDDLRLSSASSGSGNAEWNSPENRRGPSGPGYVTLYDVELESLTFVLLESELCRGGADESKLRPVLGRATGAAPCRRELACTSLVMGEAPPPR